MESKEKSDVSKEIWNAFFTVGVLLNNNKVMILHNTKGIDNTFNLSATLLIGSCMKSV